MFTEQMNVPNNDNNIPHNVDLATATNAANIDIDVAVTSKQCALNKG